MFHVEGNYIRKEITSHLQTIASHFHIVIIYIHTHIEGICTRIHISTDAKYTHTHTQLRTAPRSAGPGGVQLRQQAEQSSSHGYFHWLRPLGSLPGFLISLHRRESSDWMPSSRRPPSVCKCRSAAVPRWLLQCHAHRPHVLAARLPRVHSLPSTVLLCYKYISWI